MLYALTQWSLEPVPVLGCVCAGALYQLGARRTGSPSPWRRVSFWAGLVALLVALVSPLDAFDGTYQWVHMTQHVLLLVVAPPLILVGDPFRTAWQGLRALRADLPASPPGGPLLERVSHRGSVTAWLLAALFVADMLAWHIPRLYDLTLRTEWVHDVEHTLFLATGLLLWDQALTASRHAAGVWARAASLLAAMLASWALAVVIGYAPQPLYGYPVGTGLSPLADQQIAAGIMWVPGSIPFVIVLATLIAAWFEADDRELRAATTRAR